ncbi:MAG: phage tail tape measure protein [Pseudomonadota bacterium]
MNNADETYTIDFVANTDAFERQLSNVTRLGQGFGRSLTRAFADIAIKGKGVGDVLKSLALKLSDLVLKAAFRPLENALGGVMQGLFSGFAFANGGVVQNSMPVPFAHGGLVTQPTLFPMAAGRTGLMGEAGPEAIMPLARGADGRLGVRAGGASAGGGFNVTFNVSTPDAESFRRSETQVAAMLNRAVSLGQRNL